jgi:FKBP-type peptidyl-prolyl cis-trans isomerase 2
MNTRIPCLLSLTLLTVALNGCSTTPVIVQTGDTVELGFTCRLPDGSLAATTRSDSDIANEKKSPWYLPRNGSDTITLIAGVPPVDPKKDRVSFEEEIIKRLGGVLDGLKEGEQAVRELQAENYPATSEKERLVTMALVRKRDKEQRVTKDEYVKRAGKEPEVGQSLAMEPLLNGSVSSISDTEVVIRTSPVQGEALTTAFGPITVRETATKYELEIKTEKGRMVRVGGMVGRISAVDKERELFTIDFGHPFGGEKLRCDVTVAEVKPGTLHDHTSVATEKTTAAAEAVPAPVPGSTLDPEAEKVFNKGLAAMLAQSGQAAAAGDLVTTHYTVTLEDGSLVATTQGITGRDLNVKRVTWYREPAGYAPVELVAGKQEIMPGLGEALVGMKGGEKQRITLSPDKAFGMRDPAKMQQLPLSQSFPKTIRMPADEYVKRFSGFPVVNKEVQLMPYFPSRVVELTEQDVALEFLVTDGAIFSDSFGTIGVAVAGDTITTTLKPLVGAPFPLKEGFGIISSSDATTFTIDLNHPLAGKTITLELEAVSVTAAQAGGIDWIDDHDAGLARAKQENKPVFLMLHADWCSWCKKTFSETIPDPRIMAFKDRFVWVRVNSDKELKYKKQYGQEGYPMMVLLGVDGTVLKKIDGYRDAAALREEIRAVLN